MYAYPPNVGDYYGFLTAVVGVPENALAAPLGPPAAPVLSSVAGGSQLAATYFVSITVTSKYGESLPSAPISLAVPANSLLVVTPPAFATGALTWNVYAGFAVNTLTLQASALVLTVPWDEPATGLIAGVTPPTLDSSGAPILTTTLTIAADIANSALEQASNDIYMLAVYNLATDRLVNYAQDTAPANYFSTLRNNYKLSAFVPGVVSSSSDNGSATTMLNTEGMKNFTLQDLQTLKTPWGRQYIAFAQMYGPALWGLT